MKKLFLVLLVLLVGCSDNHRSNSLLVRPLRNELPNWIISFNNIYTNSNRDTVGISAIKGIGPGHRLFDISVVLNDNSSVTLIGARFSGWPNLPDTTIFLTNANDPRHSGEIYLDNRFYSGSMSTFYNPYIPDCPESFTYNYPVKLYLGKDLIEIDIACADWKCSDEPLHFETHGVYVNGTYHPEITDDVRNFVLVP